MRLSNRGRGASLGMASGRPGGDGGPESPVPVDPDGDACCSRDDDEAGLLHELRTRTAATTNRRCADTVPPPTWSSGPLATTLGSDEARGPRVEPRLHPALPGYRR